MTDAATGGKKILAARGRSLRTPEEADTDALKREADEASAAREREEAALYRPDGSKLYSEEVHDEKLREITARRDETIARLLERSEEAVSEARERVERVENRDPLERLSEDELARAGGRRAFVKEDAEELSLTELAGRINSATYEGDKAMLTLWSRYAERRAATERDKAHREGRAAEGLGELRDALAALGKKLAAGGRAIELRRAREKAEAAAEAARHVRSRSYTHEEKHAAAFGVKSVF